MEQYFTVKCPIRSIHQISCQVFTIAFLQSLVAKPVLQGDLVKTMLLTSNLYMLSPTQRGLVFFWLKQPSLRSDTGIIQQIPELTLNHLLVSCCVETGRCGLFKPFKGGHCSIIRFVLCMCLFMQQSLSRCCIRSNRWLGVIWRSHGFELEALQVFAVGIITVVHSLGFLNKHLILSVFSNIVQHYYQRNTLGSYWGLLDRQSLLHLIILIYIFFV